MTIFSPWKVGVGSGSEFLIGSGSVKIIRRIKDPNPLLFSLQSKNVCFYEKIIKHVDVFCCLFSL